MLQVKVSPVSPEDNGVIVYLFSLQPNTGSVLKDQGIFSTLK